MTSPHNDPNAINLDDFDLDNLNTPTSNAPEQTLEWGDLDTEADPFGEFSFEDLMAMEDGVTPATATSPLVPPQPSHTSPAPVANDVVAPEDNHLEVVSTPSHNQHPTPVNETATTPALDFDFDSELVQPTSPTGIVQEVGSTTDYRQVGTIQTTAMGQDIDNSVESQPASFFNSTLNETEHHTTPDFATTATVAGAGMAGAALLANQTQSSNPSLANTAPTSPIPSPTATLSTPAPSLDSGNPRPKDKIKGKGLFSKKEKLPNTPMPSTTPPPTNGMMKKPAPKKNNTLLLGILGALAALGAGYWFFTQSESTPAPVAKKTSPAPVASATLATPSAPVTTATTSTAAPTITNDSVSTSTQNTTTSSTASTPSLSKATVIKPEDITAPPLPADNATAKEEIDRLAQQSQQLEQQEKMMEEQLKIMNELSSKKEERIAILEKQIAEIEAQKGQAKK